MTRPVSAELAAFAVDTSWSDLPHDVQQEALRALTNGLAAGLGGAGDLAVKAILRSLRPMSAAGQCSLIGESERVDMGLAAFVNAAAINVLDFDETHVGTIIHPVAPVAGAALALAEELGATGSDLLGAIVIGIEAACRIGNAISPGHYARGWHITATCGIFGAALAASRLLRLDHGQTLHALGIASSQASGLVETLGTMAKSVGVGHAARGGLTAALMAREGIEGPSAPLEGRLAFLAVTSDRWEPEKIVEGLGADWEIQRLMYKPYPCGVVLNPVIDACLWLRTEPGFDATQIRLVEVRGSELLRARTDRPDVTRGREAQVSAQHAVSISLLRGAAGAAEFSDAAVNDPDVIALRSRVGHIVVAADMAEDEAHVRICFADGTVIQRLVTTSLGSLETPLSDGMIAEKMRALAAHGGTGVHADGVLSAVSALPAAPDSAALMQALRAQEPSVEP
ncbi:MmgE/PrpD family protein [Devosia chinhatensis]|uniref:MmgE/PrpD family protein n=1 Tax=Devosia chinhatensis TaxID=429727 RepID=A0A0F5FJX9_9HYPH|nr:MmgE/PrpD family protein [Devosia chinhatensis]KKB09146.1 hypothetical protein VE26_03855 [Devosia chinhatensis]